MARKLKTYQTSLGFFDLAIAAPSMKAALKAWGADSNLFHQGAAKESDASSFKGRGFPRHLQKSSSVECWRKSTRCVLSGTGSRKINRRAGLRLGRSELVVPPVQYFDDNADNTPGLKALEEVRRRATREGWCYRHVQAIIVAIDQYAEAATGNRQYF